MKSPWVEVGVSEQNQITSTMEVKLPSVPHHKVRISSDSRRGALDLGLLLLLLVLVEGAVNSKYPSSLKQ